MNYIFFTWVRGKFNLSERVNSLLWDKNVFIDPNLEKEKPTDILQKLLCIHSYDF